MASAAAILDWAKVGNLSSLRLEDPERVCSAVDEHGSTALHWAAGRGRTAVLHWLLEYLHIDANAPAVPRQDAGDEARGAACGGATGAAGEAAGDATGAPKASRRRGATTMGRLPLHFAARNGHVSAVRLLCAVTADADHRAKDGVSPLQLAVYGNHFEVLKCLVDEANADVLQKNAHGCTLAHWLCVSPFKDVAPTPETTESAESAETTESAATPATAASPACDGALISTAEWLLGRGVDFASPNCHGHTPLHKAAFHGHHGLCAWLLRLGPRDMGTATMPSDEAGFGGHLELQTWLKLREAPGEGGAASDAGPPLTDASVSLEARRLHALEALVCDFGLCEAAAKLVATILLLQPGDSGVAVAGLPKMHCQLWGEPLHLPPDCNGKLLRYLNDLRKVLGGPLTLSADKMRVAFAADSRAAFEAGAVAQAA